MASLKRCLKNAVFDRVPGLLRRGPRSQRRIALTFDDGPDELTPRYLDLLDDLGVRATFFVIGAAAERNPELVHEYVRRGHQIGGHGYDHKRFTRMSWQSLAEQCRRTDAAIGIRGSAARWVRPPHGSVSARSLIALRGSGYRVVLWSLDSEDCVDHDERRIAARCAPERVGEGDIVLMHEGQEWTLAALPRIVPALRDAGYELVTLDRLVA